MVIQKIHRAIKKYGILSLTKDWIVNYYILSLLFLPSRYRAVKKIKSKEKDIVADLDAVMNSCKGTMAPMQVRSEILKLLYLVEKTKPKVIVEIGTARGGTLFLFSRIAPKDSLLVSIDMPLGRFGGGYPFWNIPFYKSFASKDQEIKLIRADSHGKKTREKLEKMLNGRKIDFLFIDGDHTYGGVKRDYTLYKGLVRSGGVIAFHDIAVHKPEHECDVDKFWREVKNKSAVEIIHDKNQGWAGIGILIAP